MKRLCTICARADSKGVKNKNIKEILGKPLIAYSIIQAQESGLFTAIAVSSDSDHILEIAQQWGIQLLIKRPKELASDKSGKIPAIVHCVEEAEHITNQQFDVIVDLDVTSPLRTTEDIKGAVQLLEKKHVSNVITGCPAKHSPYFNLVEISQAGYVRLSKPLNQPIMRRQDAPKTYDMNASIYVWQRNALLNKKTVFDHDTLLYEMPQERSIDIDTLFDYEIVQCLMNKKAGESDE